MLRSAEGVHRAGVPGVSERQLFFVHPAPNSSGLSWYDHDMADALGDATFMCVDQSFVKTYNDTLVSFVHMRWSDAYVNYAECDDRDGGTCIFGDVRKHRAAPCTIPLEASAPDAPRKHPVLKPASDNHSEPKYIRIAWC